MMFSNLSCVALTILSTEPTTKAEMKLTEDSRLVKALHWRMFLLVGLMSSCCVEASGTWSSMAIPSVGSGIAELMSDGTVISMDGSGDCVKLTPDIHGSYANGTWTALSSMNYSRWNFGVAVLTNGQLFVTGGEYGGGV